MHDCCLVNKWYRLVIKDCRFPLKCISNKWTKHRRARLALSTAWRLDTDHYILIYHQSYVYRGRYVYILYVCICLYNATYRHIYICIHSTLWIAAKEYSDKKLRVSRVQVSSWFWDSQRQSEFSKCFNAGGVSKNHRFRRQRSLQKHIESSAARHIKFGAGDVGENPA